MSWIVFLMGCLGFSGLTTTRLDEKAYAVILYVAGLSLRGLSGRYHVTMASREGFRRWLHRFSRVFSVGRRFRNAVALDEAVVRLHGLRAYVWSAVDVDSGEILADTPHGAGACSPP
jgi:transposase-like protein